MASLGPVLRVRLAIGVLAAAACIGLGGATKGVTLRPISSPTLRGHSCHSSSREVLFPITENRFATVCACHEGHVCVGVRCSGNEVLENGAVRRRKPGVRLPAVLYRLYACPDCECVSAEHAAHYQRVDAATAKPAVSLEEKTALARKVLEEKPPRVFIGMVTTKEGLQGPLITAAINTWVQDVPPEWHVHLFVGDCKTLRKSPLPQLPKVQVVCMPTADDEYPPQRKILTMWEMIASQYRYKYDLAIKLDSDTFVNVLALQRFILHDVIRAGWTSTPLYIGAPGLGVRAEQTALGLSGRPYCLGMGYIMNRVVLDATAGKWASCLDSVTSNHSDTEVGRCVMRFTKAACEGHPQTFHQLYYTHKHGELFARKFTAVKQMIMPFPPRPFARTFDAALIHSIKNADEIVAFNAQVVRELRPLLPYVLPPGGGATDLAAREQGRDMYANYMKRLRMNCVNNPQVQRDLYGSGDQSVNNLFECWPTTNDSYWLPQTNRSRDLLTAAPSSWIINTGAAAAAARLRHELTGLGYRVVDDFAQTTARADVGANHSEHTRSSLIAALKAALASPEDIFLILRDRDTLVCDFKRRMREMSQSARCGAHLLWPRASGVLYLGPELMLASPEVRSRGRRDIDMNSKPVGKWAHGAFTNDADARCFNVWNSSELNCLSGLFHRHAAVEMLRWLEATGGIEFRPCELAAHLADLGYITRGASPGLALTRSSTAPTATKPAFAEEALTGPDCVEVAL